MSAAFTVATARKAYPHPQGTDVRQTVLNALQTIVPARVIMRLPDNSLLYFVLYGFYYEDRLLNMVLIDLVGARAVNAFALYEQHTGIRGTSFRPFSIIGKLGVVNLDKALVAPVKSSMVTSSLKKWLKPGNFLVNWRVEEEAVPSSYRLLTTACVRTAGFEQSLFRTTLVALSLANSLVVNPKNQ